MVCMVEWEGIVFYAVVVLFRRFLINDGYFWKGDQKEDNQKKGKKMENFSHWRKWENENFKHAMSLFFWVICREDAGNVWKTNFYIFLYIFVVTTPTWPLKGSILKCRNSIFMWWFSLVMKNSLHLLWCMSNVELSIYNNNKM